MTTGEIIGITVGVASLGFAGFVFMKSRSQMPPPPQSTVGQQYTNPNPYGTSAQLPPGSSPPTQFQSDFNAVLGGVTQGIAAAGQIFATFNSIFG